ncbi:MAG: hypothetical protein COA44_07380 [Arcobacter sp.]|nr:MAG: hypothetical protein COA44_07380 [Arcobacter sp.]
MKLTFSLLLSVLSLSATELIFVSNSSDTKNLEGLEKKYLQQLLINKGYVYLIPSDCRLNRYFGGASNGTLKLSQRPEQTNTILITQEIFEAKSEAEIFQKIEVDKSISLIEGKVSKAFLDDKEGRGFGGASEVPLNFKIQQLKATSVNMVPAKEHKVIVKDAPTHKHPSCQLLKDGSGYTLLDIKEAKFYENKKLQAIQTDIIYFH